MNLPSVRACPALTRCDAVSSIHAAAPGPAVVVALPCSHRLVALRPFSFAGSARASIRLSEAVRRCHGRSMRPPRRVERPPDSCRLDCCLPVACLRSDHAPSLFTWPWLTGILEELDPEAQPRQLTPTAQCVCPLGYIHSHASCRCAVLCLRPGSHPAFALHEVSEFPLTTYLALDQLGICQLHQLCHQCSPLCLVPPRCAHATLCPTPKQLYSPSPPLLSTSCLSSRAMLMPFSSKLRSIRSTCVAFVRCQLCGIPGLSWPLPARSLLRVTEVHPRPAHRPSALPRPWCLPHRQASLPT